jgi:hypothetical protein
MVSTLILTNLATYSRNWHDSLVCSSLVRQDAANLRPAGRMRPTNSFHAVLALSLFSLQHVARQTTD